MGEAEASLPLDLPKAVEIELSDEALELAVPKKLWGDFSLHELGIEDVDVSFCGIPGDDVSVEVILHELDDYIE